ncbi:hypothetical protein BC829DRAFT_442624 [Chytridium lagenaria]|nr:hypothetical protein BC829DRAFT_442624 [Chytridium lagenaria]
MQDQKPMDDYAHDAPVYAVPPLREGQPTPHIPSMEVYQKMHEESLNDPVGFFGKLARENLDWIIPFTDRSVKAGTQSLSSQLPPTGNLSWFSDGHLNASYNAVDRHALEDPSRPAIIWEADEPGHHETITYGQLLDDVSRFSNVLKRHGVRKGDVVAIYMPMWVFAGFSADALRDRILDASCKVLVTADQGKRGGKIVQLKKVADEAVAQCPLVERVIVYQRTGDTSVPFNEGKDVWWHEETKNQRPHCPPEIMSAEDPLFMLYTSGSTGKPKGVCPHHGRLSPWHHDHDEIRLWTSTPEIVLGAWPTSAGSPATLTFVYGPLLNGVATLVFESIPTYPTPSRYWSTASLHSLTHLYTAPTAIRALRRFGDDPVTPMPTLRVLGSVGEPINPDAWVWYHNIVGRGKCAVVDTYWQTETGSIIYGDLEPETGKELSGGDVVGVLAVKRGVPSLFRTVYGDHGRYLETYLKPYVGYYFTGDGASRDNDGYYWIRGRVDDVINVSGHRLSTAEIESALVAHPTCAEAAAIGIPDDVTGQAVICFATLRSQHADEQTISALLRTQIRTHIGPFATPKAIVIVPELPKTRSGKIMRRILRKVAGREIVEMDLGDAEVVRAKLGDTSTLADEGVVRLLVERVEKVLG